MRRVRGPEATAPSAAPAGVGADPGDGHTGRPHARVRSRRSVALSRLQDHLIATRLRVLATHSPQLDSTVKKGQSAWTGLSRTYVPAICQNQTAQVFCLMYEDIEIFQKTYQV